MKAILWTKYGSPDVLKLQDVEKPTPKANEVLIKIHATTVTAGDCEMRNLKFPFWLSIPMRLFIGLRKPTRIKILGMEVAGEIESVGPDVTKFKVGDKVFGLTGFEFGAYAEYICLTAEPEIGGLALIPLHTPYEEIVAVPNGGLEAVHFLRVGNLQHGEKILIIGAGGSIGTMAVQLAKHYGAEVTCVDSQAKLAMLRSIGADHVIDYTREDFTQNGATYDVILDVIGMKSLSRSIKSLKPEGCYLIANPRLLPMLQALWFSKRSSKRVTFEMSQRKYDDLIFLKELVEAGTIKPVIDKYYPLEQVVEAHRYVESGHKQGNVVITVVQESQSVAKMERDT